MTKRLRKNRAGYTTGNALEVSARFLALNSIHEPEKRSYLQNILILVERLFRLRLNGRPISE
jgi:hypothetical protein